MSVFSDLQAEAQPPPSFLVLQPTAWMPGWRDAPREAVCVGITTLSEDDITGVKQAAATEARRLYPHNDDGPARFDAMQDLMLRWIVARGTCDPNDVSKPFDFWRVAPEDTIKQALTAEACKALFDAIERVALETSPVISEATPEEILGVWAVSESALPRMPDWRARRVRRLLKYCFDELAPFVPEDVEVSLPADVSL